MRLACAGTRATASSAGDLSAVASARGESRRGALVFSPGGPRLAPPGFTGGRAGLGLRTATTLKGSGPALVPSNSRAGRRPGPTGPGCGSGRCGRRRPAAFLRATWRVVRATGARGGSGVATRKLGGASRERLRSRCPPPGRFVQGGASRVGHACPQRRRTGVKHGRRSPNVGRPTNAAYSGTADGPTLPRTS